MTIKLLHTLGCQGIRVPCRGWSSEPLVCDLYSATMTVLRSTSTLERGISFSESNSLDDDLPQRASSLAASPTLSSSPRREANRRVVAAYESGHGSYPTIAEQFSIGEATVKRWAWLQEATGDLRPTPKRGGAPSTISVVEIEKLIASLRDPTAGELTVEYNRTRRRRARVHASSMKRALHRYGYDVKKAHTAAGESPAGCRQQATRIPEAGPARSGEPARLSRRVRHARVHE